MKALDAAEQAASHIEHTLPHVWQAICNLSAAIQQVDDRLVNHIESLRKKAVVKTEPPSSDLYKEVARAINIRIDAHNSTLPKLESHPEHLTRRKAEVNECVKLGNLILGIIREHRSIPIDGLDGIEHRVVRAVEDAMEKMSARDKDLAANITNLILREISTFKPTPADPRLYTVKLDPQDVATLGLGGIYPEGKVDNVISDVVDQILTQWEAR